MQPVEVIYAGSAHHGGLSCLLGSCRLSPHRFQAESVIFNRSRVAFYILHACCLDLFFECILYWVIFFCTVLFMSVKVPCSYYRPYVGCSYHVCEIWHNHIPSHWLPTGVSQTTEVKTTMSVWLTGHFADKPTRSQSPRGLTCRQIIFLNHGKTKLYFALNLSLITTLSTIESVH